jgi:ribA/ribD-fused uncharacterized protein
MNTHTERTVGVIDSFSTKIASGWKHSFLSNGYAEPDGTFVEREYQACKTSDPEYAKKILRCEKPFGPDGSKQLGRETPTVENWEDIKFQVMARCVSRKFHDHPDLAASLLATDDALLIEGNTWHDNTWGDCHCGRTECASPGLNWLGQILMTVRETLRHKSK